MRIIGWELSKSHSWEFQFFSVIPANMYFNLWFKCSMWRSHGMLQPALPVVFTVQFHYISF